MALTFRRLLGAATLGNLQLRNRIVMPAITTNLASVWGEVTDDTLEWYAVRARGGVGLIIVEGTFVATAIDQVRNPLLALRADDECYSVGLSRLAEVIHEGGSRAGIQLSPGLGAQARGSPFIPGRYLEEVRPVAPSLVTSPEAKRQARALTADEIKQMVALFAAAARRVKRVGFDLIEVHAHAGHLLAQFMSPYFNKRTDQYGGSPENRARFLMEIIDAARAEVGPAFPITVKYSIDEFVEGGRDLNEGLAIAKRLEKAGVTAISISEGIHGSRMPSVPPMYYPEATMLPLAEALRKTVSTSLILQGRLGDAVLAESVLAQGKADFIGIGRQLIADPELPEKLASGRYAEIRPCISCNACMKGVTQSNWCAMRCSVNAAAARERAYGSVQAAAVKKKVVVVGAGPAGMEAARVSALRGHEVTLFEKNSSLAGGQVAVASRPPNKQVLGKLIGYYSAQFKQLPNLTVKLGSAAAPKDIRVCSPDALILATGGEPLVPDIPGVGQKSVVTAFNILTSKVTVKDSAVIIGGGMVGCETANFLAKQGKKITVLEQLPAAAVDMEPWSWRALKEELVRGGVSILTERRVTQISEKGVAAVNGKGESETYPADTVVLAMGIRPVNKLAEKLKSSRFKVKVIGDANEPGDIRSAVSAGFVAAYHL